MDDEGVFAALFLTVVTTLLVVLGLVVTGRLYPVVAIAGLATTAAAIGAGVSAWKAWLHGDRHRLATKVRAQRAELAHRKAEALLALELDAARHDAGRARQVAGDTATVIEAATWGSPTSRSHRAASSSARAAEGR